MANINTIHGGISHDERGQIRFVNEFDMTLVKRFYIIKNLDTELVRGWRAHRVEQRWFYVLSGAFTINLVKIDNWENPDPCLSVESIVLKSSEMKVLNIPPGYGTAFRALESNSELLAYSDYLIENAQSDNYIWPADYFVKCRP